MEPRPSAERALQHTLFLTDGLCRAPSPVLLVVGKEVTAAQVARAVYEGSAWWEDRPTRVGRLLQLDLAKIAADPEGDFTGLLAELAGSDHWVYLPNVDSLVESPPGRRFLDGLMAAVGGGEIAAVITSATPERLAKVHAETPRLMGFATSLQDVGDSDGAVPTYTRSIACRSTDRSSLGWIVAVRYELSGPIRGDADTKDDSTDGRLLLVDTINMVVKHGEPPLGVLVSLMPDAFTVSQEDAAFTSAALAAERLVGRPLGPKERVTATRGIFYA